MVFVEIDFEVTTTVAVHNTPGFKPIMVTQLFTAITLDEVNTDKFSASLFTVTSIWTLADGKVEIVKPQNKVKKYSLISRAFQSLIIKPIMTWNNFLLSNQVRTTPSLHLRSPLFSL